MAKAMVCSEQHHILLLREWERYVLSCLLRTWMSKTEILRILDFVFWIQTSSRRARFILMATVQSWCPAYAKTPKRIHASSWALLEDVLTRFNTLTLLISVAVFSYLAVITMKNENSLQINDDSFSLQFTASGPREAREWVDQINFVLKGMWDMKYIFIRIHNIYYAECIWLDPSTMVIILRWKGQFFIYIKKGIPITFFLAQPIR